MEEKLPAPTRAIPDRELTRSIIGAFFKSYNILGHGFLESVYRRSLVLELRERGLSVLEETPVEVAYRGEIVGFFRLDVLVEQRIAIELKSSATLGPTDKRQLLNYLRATTLDIGLLLHYGPEPKVHRLVSPRYLNAEKN